MLRTTFLLLTALASTAFAQESSYTGPRFNPSNAPYFGVSSLVIPTLTDRVPSVTQTPTFIRPTSSSAGISVPASETRSASTGSLRSSSATLATSVSSSGSVSRSASASAPAQTGGAAGRGVGMGVVVAGVVVGLGML